ncbi:MAG: hypothetical protein AABY22_37140, partial [Nanoarchaeota archaeon]
WSFILSRYGKTNLNNADKCFYTAKYEYPIVYEPKFIRAEIYLRECGTLKASHSGRLLYYEPIVLNISIIEYIQASAVCFQWTRNLLTVSLQNYSKIEIPERLKNKVVKCYDLKTDLNDESILLNVSYKEIAPLQLSDEIIIYIIDSDYRIDLNKLFYENEDKLDFAAPDFKYIIK